MRARSFAARAKAEIRRYGLREWVFVRELIQNARDGGACGIWFSCVRDGDVERLICRDDGKGMGLDEARRDLFTLYASHKSAGRDAGRFGVGFWSILNFEPSKVIIRSCAVVGEGWQLVLNGNLDHGEFEAAEMAVGTEVVLERSGRDVDVPQCVRRIVHDDAPFVRCESGHEKQLQVFVDGHPMQRDFDLPAPRVRFRRRGLRGVVALGKEPRVEVFNHGLKVRTATALDDLLIFDPTSSIRLRSRIAPDEIGGLYPQVMLDSPHFDVLMNRGDLRENRALRQAVDVARAEVIGLVKRELDRLAPQSFFGRCRGRLSCIASRKFRLVAGFVLVGAILGIAAGWLVKADPVKTPLQAEDNPSWFLNTIPLGYRSFGDYYAGPALRPLGEDVLPIDLHYEPRDQNHYFAAWQVVSLSGNGVVEKTDIKIKPAAVRHGNSGEAVSIILGIDASRGKLRLPVPTDQIVDPDRVELDGRTIELFESEDRSPYVWFLKPARGTLRYRCELAPSYRPLIQGSWPEAPVSLRSHIAGWAGLSLGDRVEKAMELVATVVRYDTSEAAISRFEAVGIDRGYGRGAFFEQALEAGVGDCDVQASLLVALLREMHIESAMMAGWVGEDGGALVGLHAWVEYVDGSGRRRVADTTLYGTAENAAPHRVAVAEPVVNIDDWSTSYSEWIFLVIFVMLVVLVAILIRRRKPQRFFEVGLKTGLAGLIRGALNRPEAYQAVPSLFSRPIVPLVDGRMIALDRARAGAAASRLCACRHPNEWSDEAVRGGLDVIDSKEPVGRVVAEFLKPTDLDLWKVMINNSVADEATVSVEETLADFGQDWRIRSSDDAQGSVLKLDLGTRRILLVDDAILCANQGPAAVRLVATVLRLVSQLALEPHEERRLLRAVAIAALEN